MRSLLSGEKFEICVTHYYRGRDKDNVVKRFHRAIFVITDNRPEDGGAVNAYGTVYQVIHGRPIFEYSTTSDVDITLKQAERYSGKVFIGKVSKKDMKKVEQVLRGLEVVRDINSDWCCQEWVREGIKRLAEEGLIDKEVPEWLDDALKDDEGKYLAASNVVQQG